MEVLILFESCTGNTRLAAEAVRRTLVREGHTCVMRKYRETPPAGLEGFDLYCFAFPIQSFAPLPSVYDYVKAMPDLPGKPAFIVTSAAGWAGAGHRMMARLLRGHGMTVLGAHLLACPDNWPLGRVVDRHFYGRVTFPRKRSLYKLRSFAVEMANRAYRFGDGIPVERSPLHPLAHPHPSPRPLRGDRRTLPGLRDQDGRPGELLPLRYLRGRLPGRCDHPRPLPRLQRRLYGVLGLLQQLPALRHPDHRLQAGQLLQGHTRPRQAS